MVTDPDPSREHDNQEVASEMVTEPGDAGDDIVTNEGEVVTDGSAGDVGAITKEDYTTAKWKGLTVWQCAHCAYDTLAGEGDIIKHVRQRHKPRVTTVTLPLVGPDGKPIERQVIHGPD